MRETKISTQCLERYTENAPKRTISKLYTKLKRKILRVSHRINVETKKRKKEIEKKRKFLNAS